MKIDDITQASLLYDFYGQLLPKRQREVIALYHEENLTLSEIAGEFQISRQGVHDALKNAEKALHEYESKLGLVAKFEKSRTAISEIDEIIDGVIAQLQRDGVPEAQDMGLAAGCFGGGADLEGLLAAKAGKPAISEKGAEAAEAAAVHPNAKPAEAGFLALQAADCMESAAPQGTLAAVIRELKKAKEIIDNLEE